MVCILYASHQLRRTLSDWSLTPAISSHELEVCASQSASVTPSHSSSVQTPQRLTDVTNEPAQVPLFPFQVPSRTAGTVEFNSFGFQATGQFRETRFITNTQ